MSKIANAKSYSFQKGHILYKEGDKISGNSIFLIKSGMAEIKYRLNNGKIIKFKIPSGGFAGIFETLAEEKVRSTEVEFIEDSLIFMWDKENFDNDVSIIQELGMKSIGFLSTFLRTLNHKIQEL